MTRVAPVRHTRDMDRAWDDPPAAKIPAPLRTHVEAMYGYAGSGLVPGVHRGLPSHSLTLVLSLDRPLTTAPSEQSWADGVRDSQWVTIGGLHTRAAMVEQPGEWAGVQLTLNPLGIQALLGVPTADLPVGSWDAGDLFGTDADRVVDEMHAAADWAGRYEAVMRFLLRRRRLARRGSEPVRTSAEVREAWRLLTRRGDLGVDDVAREVGYSRRRLHQLFDAEVGHGPKTVQRLARFDRARRVVANASAAGTTLAEVAARAGYYDQSHLVREFREFAGLGPTAWLAAERRNLQGTSHRGEAAWSA